MAASKSCPSCSKQWADTFRFCPEDGALLVASDAVDPKKTVAARPAANPSRQAAPTVVTRPPAERPSETAPRPRRDPQRRFINLEPVVPTKPGLVKKARAPAEAAAPETKKKAQVEGEDFSETAWFMRPDYRVDPETGKVTVDAGAYRRDESIPEEERRRFSLRRKNEE